MFFATTQATAAWLLSHLDIREAILRNLIDGTLQTELKRGQFIEGAVRALSDKSGQIVAILNVDYEIGRLDQGIGLLKLNGEFGILAVPQIISEVFERALLVIEQRLRNLVFESRYFHQSFGNGAHKVLAGRGAESRNFSIGYVEPQTTIDRTTLKVVLCVGPEKDWHKASNAALAEGSKILSLTKAALPLLEGRVADGRLLPPSVLVPLRHAIAPNSVTRNPPNPVQVTKKQTKIFGDEARYRTLGWSYDDWNDSAELTDEQRSVLNGDGLRTQPIRLIGAAGTGKTLLMQLLAIKRLREAVGSSQAIRVAYLTHNDAMRANVYERFHVLGAQDWLSSTDRPAQLTVTTLSSYSRDVRNISVDEVLGTDAAAAKDRQLDLILDALDFALRRHAAIVYKSPILSAFQNDPIDYLEYVRADFSVAIKGQNKWNDKAGYIGAERSLSKLHGLLSPDERSVIFDAFLKYQADLDIRGVFDVDDIAISLLSELRNPVWRKRRHVLGFDYIFVDEAQLFNENEQRTFNYLSKGETQHAPIALALDQAQQFFGESSIGLGALGIENVDREALSVVQRMSEPVAALAFFVISHSTALFSPDFPDFTAATLRSPVKDEPDRPLLVTCHETETLVRAVVKRVREFRKLRCRHIAIVCHPRNYWAILEAGLASELSDLDFSVLQDRGQRLDPHHRFTVLSRPDAIGGQEFDAVICVGLENGLVPKTSGGAAELDEALSQQALREMYLAFSRAKQYLTIINEFKSTPSDILQQAIIEGYLRADSTN